MNHKSNVKNSSDFEHFGILSISNIKRNKFSPISTTFDTNSFHEKLLEKI